MKKITIIGAGVMGSVMTRAIQQWNKDIFLFVTNRGQEKLEELKRTNPEIEIGEDNKSAIVGADIVFICVKPQVFSEVVKEIKGFVEKNTTVVSLMAGIDTNRIKNSLVVKKVIRIMPNLGAKVGKSMTVWTTSGEVDRVRKEEIKGLLGFIGKELFFSDEAMIDKATAVSGSGLGFFYYIIEQWITSVENLGFSRSEAETLVLATVDGSNAVLRKGDKPLDLVSQVASKGGTTEAGLEVLKKHNLGKIWDGVLQTAEKRAKKLSS